MKYDKYGRSETYLARVQHHLNCGDDDDPVAAAAERTKARMEEEVANLAAIAALKVERNSQVDQYRHLWEGCGARLRNCIINAYYDEQINSISFEEVIAFGKAKWQQQPNFGKRTLAELERYLAKHGFCFIPKVLAFECEFVPFLNITGREHIYA